MIVLYYLFLSVYLIVTALLCAVILVQENKSLGLGAAFGGGDVSNSLFGTDTAAVIKKLTAWLAAIFFVGCIILSLWTSSLSAKSKATVDNFAAQSELEV